MSREILFAVGVVKKEHPADLLGREVNLPLSWADDMVGVIPVFDSEKSAEKYADNKFLIYKIQTVKEEEDVNITR